MMHGYTHILALTHKQLEGFWNGQAVLVQEKVDGSQVSFSRDENGSLTVRSRNAQVEPGSAGMFDRAVDTIMALPLHWGWTYRGEYLRSPKHNTLAYARVPKGHIILFDVDRGNQDYLEERDLREEAERLGLEVVPTVDYCTRMPSPGVLAGWLEHESILGGCRIEGVVFKNYSLFGEDGKVLMGKVVREDFKEVHRADWKERNPGQNDFVDQLAAQYATEARWRKAAQHLAEAGELQNAPQDIPALLKEVTRDVQEECRAEIAEALFRYFWQKTISRAIVRGLPEWWKGQLT